MDAQADHATASETAVRTAIGAGSAMASSRIPGVRHVSQRLSTSVAVRELAGEVPSGSAASLVNGLEAGIGVIAGQAFSEVSTDTANTIGDGIDAAASTAAEMATAAFGCGNNGGDVDCRRLGPR